MKLKTLLLSMMLFLFSIAAFAKSNITFLIKGMHCQKCTQNIRASFQNNDAIETISVNFETRTADVQLKANKTLSDAEIKTLLEKVGYELESIQR
ncbi:MAG: hypothetical protein COX62_02685 [Deltaproteobacteria bacterium CG_4_10_14_0_2_um_filter_43_8]|nr:MAG: hypothetical protein COV43_02580 [Deltaproteobacteria bacterium CG11_big_fil_rev_8_21_14_0_20_42_23]PJA21350.1 MAG: hypothetical protein COX62_02685 [Deltaproteobacteria bacterium CG_4_10_14_0_2_um_filter_43_8]PJC64810.1 MAG: hypothetical protein CO021_02375 [Deltaproteobacteria bacterium CG_4_9_14_0_2_um_filter_42_21]